MRTPLIHLNGTDGDQLVSDWREATKAMRLAKEAISRMTMNPRDYYPLGDLAYSEAFKRWRKIVTEVEDLHAELLEGLRELAVQNATRKRLPESDWDEDTIVEVGP